MRNWSNPTFDGTLEEAAQVMRQRTLERRNTLIGFEVERVSDGTRRVCQPIYNSLGFAPQVGERIHLGGTDAEWRVLRTAQVNHRTDGRIEIHDEQGSTLL